MEAVVEETRHYIGITELGRLHMTLGPADPAKFKTPATEPITVGSDTLYPVSAEVAEEWTSDDEDEADGSALSEWDDEDDL